VAFDTLRLTDPGQADRLAVEFPEFEREVLGPRSFGSSDAIGPRPGARRKLLARKAVAPVVEALRQSLDEVLKRVRRRAAWLARIRLVSGLIALTGSAGVIAAMSPAAQSTQLWSALAGFAGAAAGLLVAFIEDQTGGDGSAARLRERMFEQVGALAQVQAELRRPDALASDEAVVALMERVSRIAAEVQSARSRVGLPLDRI
jgi:hypothetical protein